MIVHYLQYKSLIIKPAEWYLIDFITSKLVILTSDVFHYMMAAFDQFLSQNQTLCP